MSEVLSYPRINNNKGPRPGTLSNSNNSNNSSRVLMLASNLDQVLE